MACFEDFEKVDERLSKVLTQYRESPKLLHLARTYLRQVEIIAQSICDLPSFFDLDGAVGDQLTFLGRRLGFPRKHCVCDVQPTFGFDCESADSPLPVDGFCTDATWIDCANLGVSFISIENDDLYRKFLGARRFQMTEQFNRTALEKVIRDFWGEQAMIMDAKNGQVVIAPGRLLTPAEMAVIQLYPRVLPVAIGTRIYFHFGPLRVFGFGGGWGGFCDGIGADGPPLLTEDDEELMTEQDLQISTDALDIHSDWMCAIDVRPYDC